MTALLKKRSKNARLPVPLGLPPLLGLGGIPREWSDEGGFVNSPELSKILSIREHGAFEINRKQLGLCGKDQTSHKETWIHLSHVSTPRVEQRRAQ